MHNRLLATIDHGREKVPLVDLSASPTTYMASSDLGLDSWHVSHFDHNRETVRTLVVEIHGKRMKKNVQKEQQQRRTQEEVK
jgi:hypothetical protein